MSCIPSALNNSLMWNADEIGYLRGCVGGIIINNKSSFAEL
jgi:hypothetical protein